MAKEFIQLPSIEVLEKFKKTELLEVANELELEVKRSMRKHNLKRIIVDQLVDDDMLSPDCLELYKPLPMDSSGQAELKRLELENEFKLKQLEIEAHERDAQREREAQRELEAQKLEAQSRQLELEARKYERELDHERELKALELRGREFEFRKVHEESMASKFDLSKNVRLVPPFNEGEIDKYFQHFEKVAKSLDWPVEKWPLLLQCVLKGKAQEAYSALSVDECSNYDRVKQAILKAYELVPEAYRQKFRNYRKQESQTYVEFAHEKEVYFDRWCNSKEVGTDFENLRQIVLLEEFKRCVRDDIKTYLDEQIVENLQNAATFADDYALTHKSTFHKNKNFSLTTTPAPDTEKKFEIKTPNKDTDKSTTANHFQNKDKRYSRSFAPVCHYCKKSGHVMSDCWF